MPVPEVYDWIFDTSDNPKASWSSIAAAIRDARRVTGRNCNDGKFSAGKPPENTDPGMWLGAIGYMTVIDQLGKIFVGLKGKDQNRFCGLLNKFSSRISNSDSLVLYSLRCALVHDYSLLGTKSDKRTPEYKFCLSQTIGGQIVQFHKNIVLNDVSVPAYVINLREFGELAEAVFEKCKNQMAGTNPPRIDPDIENMLKERYQFSIGALKDVCK